MALDMVNYKLELTKLTPERIGLQLRLCVLKIVRKSREKQQHGNEVPWNCLHIFK